MDIKLIDILKTLPISTSIARRFILQDSIYLNGELINSLEDLDKPLSRDDTVKVRSVILDVGKFFDLKELAKEVRED